MSTLSQPFFPHVLLGAYLLGVLGDDEERTFTEHLAACSTCQRDLDAAQHLPQLLSLTDGANPSEDGRRQP
ncbi:zf-HC2 domain-containing protein [Terrabacter sp. C0L_2]|uniref:zf-HC2 domain-containing protein n=1 Tax=Terrabacter sp. C0L_2 TaxID=3108389 RepID=UPI00182BEA74|nr:zf-HC2 domain-containing protein [Dermatophilaceae bacterium]WVM95465.1 zf-HC2 domain-containing protein [Terrabacter sp. C0L_2]